MTDRGRCGAIEPGEVQVFVDSGAWKSTPSTVIAMPPSTPTATPFCAAWRRPASYRPTWSITETVRATE
ncbi:hypothetical protein [Skermania piniformis]|uniref:Uncharacterized protein n=1 Tax=Skermania pinensis TaxID=39122 RepID=A0ABX8SH80_9ACTN|nr:hypothetical protein [Skermania piniformis]QXQ15031.1 hypothetical protein KV203_06660 [Skermania piniformis]